jgi:hypothetical protein
MAKKIGVGLVFGWKTVQNHVKNYNKLAREKNRTSTTAEHRRKDFPVLGETNTDW